MMRQPAFHIKTSLPTPAAMAAAAMRSSLLTAHSRPFLRSVAPIRVQRASMSLQAAAKQVISTDQAPAALGPYSQAIKAGNTIYVSGQLGIAPGSKSFVSEGVEGQTKQALENMGQILEAAGGSYTNVVKTTVLLADMGDFAAMNGVYGQVFKESPPARACFAVKTLPLNARVEIEAVAVL